MSLQIVTPLQAKIAELLKAFAPPPDITISEWADINRQLSPESSAEVGQWSTSRTEYMREIMDVILDPGIEKVICMFCAQAGKTELQLNIIGYFMEHDPSPILLVMPTLDLASTFSKDRFTPMVRDTKCLHAKIGTKKAKDSSNTILKKTFQGGQIKMGGANSAASLRSMPIRLVMCDEVDGYPVNVEGEGDPVALAEARATTFLSRKIIVLTSTPTQKGKSRIEAAYEASDQRKFHVPCIQCGAYQILQWRQVKWPKGDNFDLSKTYYECQHCGAHLSDADKNEMVKNGFWQADKPTRKVAGFWLNGIYSPWLTLEDMATKWLEAINAKNKGNVELLRTFFNTILGESFEDTREARKEDSVLRLKDDRPRGLVPQDISCIMCIVDTQKEGFWYEVVAFGWGQELESWQIREGYVETFAALRKIISEDQYLDINGGKHVIGFSLIDSGGDKTAEVYKFCHTMPNCWPLKGQQKMTKMWSVTQLDFYPGKIKPIPGGLKLYNINTSHFKNYLSTKLKISPADPGAWHLHKDVDFDYAHQMCAEYKDASGIWQCPDGRDNHYWDLGVYRLAAAEMMGVKFWDKEPQQQKRRSRGGMQQWRE